MRYIHSAYGKIGKHRVTMVAKQYNVTSRLIHWVMAILVLGMIPVGFLMVQDGLSRSLQNFLFISHKNIGVLLLLFIFVRVINRWLNPPNLEPVQMAPIQALAAHATHIGLYALLLIMPLAGYIRVRAGGFPIESLDAMGIPALVPKSDALADVAKAIHFYGSYAIAALIVMHIGAALLHAFVIKDGVMARMWPPFGRRS